MQNTTRPITREQAVRELRELSYERIGSESLANRAAIDARIAEIEAQFTADEVRELWREVYGEMTI